MTTCFTLYYSSLPAGNKLPKSIYGATVVQQPQSFYIVGGYTFMEGYLDSIYSYDVDSDSWTELDVTLPRKAHTVAAMMVDRSIFPSCAPTGRPLINETEGSFWRYTLSMFL